MVSIWPALRFTALRDPLVRRIATHRTALAAPTRAVRSASSVPVSSGFLVPPSLAVCCHRAPMSSSCAVLLRIRTGGVARLLPPFVGVYPRAVGSINRRACSSQPRTVYPRVAGNLLSFSQSASVPRGYPRVRGEHRERAVISEFRRGPAHAVPDSARVARPIRAGTAAAVVPAWCGYRPSPPEARTPPVSSG